MSQETVTDNDMLMLTDAEREALKEDAAPDVEQEVIESLTKEDVPEPEPATEPVQEPDPEPDPIKEPEPVQYEKSYRYPELSMTETVPPELAAAKDVLAQRFDDGDMTLPAYMAEVSKIDRQITALQIQEAQQMKEYNRWMDAQDQFLAENRQYTSNKILYGALDSAVAEVRAMTKAAFMSPSQILAEADGLIKKAFGLEQKQEAKQEAKKPAEEAKQKPKAELPAVPALSSVPQAAANGTDPDPFAKLDRLSGEDKERELAKLSPYQLEQYLRG